MTFHEVLSYLSTVLLIFLILYPNTRIPDIYCQLTSNEVYLFVIEIIHLALFNIERIYVN